MKERPILFKGAMVRAILEGRKTQTRRVVKPVGNDGGFVILDYGKGGWPYRSDDGDSAMHTVKRSGKLYLDESPHASPYGQPGDRLWVRETWAYHVQAIGSVCDEDGPFVYRADSMADQHRLCDKWTPSIHMPRFASRITLEITSVRVERLNNISEADAVAEGIEHDENYPPLWKRGDLRGDQNTVKVTAFPKLAYRSIWEAINGADSWQANPWVWVVEFKKLEGGAA